jgi:tartrate-resistant acid phosphatase type 5
MKKSKITAAVFCLFLAAVAVAWFQATYRPSSPVTTVNLEPEESLQFLIIGDGGTGNAAQYKVAQAAESYCQRAPLKAIVSVGDNFYQAGVASEKDPKWDKALWKPYGSECLSKLPIIAILGNHDYNGDVSAQIKMSQKNKRWIMPNRFFEVNFGTRLKLLAVDTNVLDFCLIKTLCTMDFLYDAARERKGFDWVVALAHHPLGVSASQKYTEVMTPRDVISETFLKPYLCDNTDAVIAGHSHHLEHYGLVHCKSHQFISGGGGADVYPTAPTDDTHFHASQHGFLIMEVTADALRFSFYDDEATILYTGKIVKY